MSSRRRARARAAARAVVGLLVGLACCAGLMLSAPDAASASTPTRATRAPANAGMPGATAADPAGTSLRLTSIVPPVATPGIGVVITGTIVPLPGHTYVNPTVRAVRGRVGLTSRSAVAAWASDGASGPAVGTEVGRVTIPGTVAAGGSLAFRLEVPAESVRQRSAVAAVPVTIELSGAAGSLPAGGAPELVRTFVGWHGAVEYLPLAVSWVVPVTLDPDPTLYAAAPPERERAWAALRGEDSRLTRLVRAAQSRPVDLAVDPAVLGPTLAPLAREVPVAVPTAQPGSGTPTGPPSQAGVPAPTAGSAGTSGPSGASGSADAGVVGGAEVGAGAATRTAAGTIPQSPLHQALAAAAARHPLVALPYGDPDVAALGDLVSDPRRGADSPATKRAVADQLHTASAVRDRLGMPMTPAVAWPADGAWPADRELALRAAGSGQLAFASSALTSRAAMTPSALARSDSGTLVVRWDDELSRLFGQGISGQRRLLAVQQFIAESAMILQERPSVFRSVLVLAPRGSAVDPAALAQVVDVVATVPWLRSISMAAHLALADDRSAPIERLGEPPADGSRGLPAGVPASHVTAQLLEELTAERDVTTAVQGVLAADTRLIGPWRELALQCLGTRWRTAPADYDPVSTARVAVAQRLTDGLSVTPQTTNFLADEGVLQVTVVNDLDEPVTGLHVVLTPTNARLSVLEPAPAIDIGARSRAIVPVRLGAVAQGLVPIEAQLTNAAGAPVGHGALIEVRAAPPGAWLYVTSAGLLLLLLALGVYRTLRRPRPPGPDVHLDPIEPLPELPLP